MTPAPRLILVLALLQFLFVGPGYLLARILLKLVEKNEALLDPRFSVIDWHMHNAPVLTASALFVGHCGLLFLLAPILLFVIVMVREKYPSLMLVTPYRLAALIIVTAIIMLLFSLGALYAMQIAFGTIIT